MTAMKKTFKIKGARPIAYSLLPKRAIFRKHLHNFCFIFKT